MKKWLIDNFLPLWAKETVLSDNIRLKREIRAIKQENEQMRAYIRGIETGIRAGKRIHIHAGGGA